MALCRCPQLHAWPIGKKRVYVASVEPVGFPNQALICGSKRCVNPAVIWLEQSEVDAYREGERIFSGPTNMTRVTAGEGGIIE